MTFHIIGLGLNDERDITLRGLDIIKKCKQIYLESYTSKLNCSKQTLEKLYKKRIRLADRILVEQNPEVMLQRAKKEDIALLIVGDPLSATTHIDLILRARELKVEVNVVFNASILTAVGITGLQLYKFGKTTSIVFPQQSYFPESAYDTIKMNLKNKLHTLCLLDIHAEKKRYMTIGEAIDILLRIENKRKENVFTRNTLVVGCSCLGANNQVIAGKASEILKKRFKQGMQCLIVPGELHFMEKEFLGI
ncbi:diphthine synthase [Candidatus Woesearchaeota archaeon]|nr:MAG: diphthine synthase [Candidatus Woesearchaeota archaeon]